MKKLITPEQYNFYEHARRYFLYQNEPEGEKMENIAGIAYDAMILAEVKESA